MPAPMIPETQPPQPGDLVTVTAEELERALCVWLKTAPSRVWEPYLKMLAIDRTRRTDADRADPRDLLAAYLTAKFAQVRWSATRIQPEAVTDRSTPAR